MLADVRRGESSIGRETQGSVAEFRSAALLTGRYDTQRARPKWRNGIRDGLKHHWAQALVGSNPTFGTITNAGVFRTMPSRPRRRFIGYPTDSLMAVLPTPEAAAAAAAALRAAGVPDRDITILRGDEGADRLDGTGAVNGVVARLRRLVSFTLMDQLVDMAVYEQAVREGHAVVMVKARGERKAAAIAILREHGGHFINYYGRFATEEVERWHGPEPKVAGLLRR
jgi:hypothetical protein